MSPHVEEEVIKRRLLIDGDGTGDDRRLSALLKTFLKWSSPEESFSSAESKSMQEKMLSQLALCEYSFTKSRVLANTTAKEMKNYEDFTKGITADIEKAKQDIEDQKEEFEKTKSVRKNKMEYEVLAHTINEHASRDKIFEDLDDIRDELYVLEGKSNEVAQQVMVRRNQCHIMNTSIQQLRGLLYETEEEYISSDDSQDVLDMFDDDDMDILSRQGDIETLSLD